MDPEVWKHLPYDCLERIAHFADIDARRAMGFKPRRLPRIEFDPKPMRSVEYRYYMSEKKLWYFEMTEYMRFFFEVQTGIELVDPTVPLFRYTDGSRNRSIIYTENTTDVSDVLVIAPMVLTFQTAGFPIWIA